MSRSLVLRVMLGAVAFAVVSVALETSAEAGLFKHRHRCCPQETTCCEAEPVCCEKAPTCCEPAPVCCEEVVEPACCEPACETDCCKPKRKRGFGLFKLFRKNNCCEPVCGC